LYAREVMSMNEVDAAAIASGTMWVRPIAAVLAGTVGDRFRIPYTTVGCFVCLGLFSSLLASDVIHAASTTLFVITIGSTAAMVFALRGLYFAMIQDAAVPIRLTGTAVGLVSAIGFLPDVFMGPFMGYLLDRSPGRDGHADVFAVVAVFAAIGCIATIGVSRLGRVTTADNLKQPSIDR
ncbi:MAG: MFS transporter, partial [Planctomycetota bacterium]